MTAPLFDEVNYHNGFFKPYKIDEITAKNLLDFCDTLEQVPGINKKDFEVNFLSNVELIINLRGNIMSYEKVVLGLKEQLKGYQEVLHRAEEANRHKDKQLSELNRKDTAKIKQWISKNMDSMEKIKQLEKNISQKDEQINTISSSCTDLTRKNSELEDKFKKQEKKIREHGNVLNQLRASHKSELDSKNKEIEDIKNKLTQMNHYINENKTFKEQLSLLNGERLNLNSNIDKITKDKNSIKFLHDKINKDYSNLKLDFDSKNKLLQDKDKVEKQLGDKINQLTRQIEENNAQIIQSEKIKSEFENLTRELVQVKTNNSTNEDIIKNLELQNNTFKIQVEQLRMQLVQANADNITLSNKIRTMANISQSNTQIVNNPNSKNKSRNRNGQKNHVGLQVQTTQPAQINSEQLAQYQNLQQVHAIQQLKLYQQLYLHNKNAQISNSNSPVLSPTQPNQEQIAFVNQQLVQGFVNESGQVVYLTNVQDPNQVYMNYVENGYTGNDSAQTFDHSNVYSNYQEHYSIMYTDEGIPYYVDSNGCFLGYCQSTDFNSNVTSGTNSDFNINSTGSNV